MSVFTTKEEKERKKKKKGHKKSLGGDEYFCSLECGNGIVGIYVCKKSARGLGKEGGVASRLSP